MAMILREAINSEGKPIRLLFGMTHSWQSFVIEGMPSRMGKMERKQLSLSKVVSAWNLAVKNKADALSVVSVSEGLRQIADAVAKAKYAH